MLRLAAYKGRRTAKDIAIQMVTGGQYSHCELVHRLGMCVSASLVDGRKVRVKRIDLDPARWDVFPLPWADEAAAWQRALSVLGQPYDLRGAASVAFGRRWHSPGAWFCSEHNAWALGFPEPWRHTPHTLVLAARHISGMHSAI